MSSGREQVIEAAAICRQIAAQVAGQPGGDQLEKLAVRFERLQHRFFVKTPASLKYTQPCLEALQSLRQSLEGGAAGQPGGGTVEAGLASVTGPLAALEQKCLPTGDIVIT